MSEFLNSFFFGIYPYLAVGVMVFGSILRYDRDPYSWKADSSPAHEPQRPTLGQQLVPCWYPAIVLWAFSRPTNPALCL